MTKEQIIDFFDKNCTMEQQKFLAEFMKEYLNAGKKVKKAIIIILDEKIKDTI